jgi:hypothetical protein
MEFGAVRPAALAIFEFLNPVRQKLRTGGASSVDCRGTAFVGRSSGIRGLRVVLIRDCLRDTKAQYRRRPKRLCL